MWWWLWLWTVALANPAPFESFGVVPTWEGIVVDTKGEPEVHLIDTQVHEGHYAYARSLEPELSRRTFVAEVSDPDRRRWMPFMLFDLRQDPIQEDGQVWQWALQVRRYRYGDDDDGLAREIAALARRVSAEIMPHAGPPRIVVYDKGGRLRPNERATEALEQEGLSPMTMEDLLHHVDAVSVSILNEGVAQGRLVWARGQRLLPTDIAIYEQVPEHAPPLAGIVSLQPVTPLSHLNLLARSRGTVHIQAAGIESLPSLASRMGSWVRLTAVDGRLSVEDASPVAAPVRKSVSLERAQDTGLTVVRFSREPRPSTSEVGAKAAGYARLLREQPARTRPGGAIGFGLYLDVVRRAGVGELVDSLVDCPQAELDERLQQIREGIESTHIEPALLAEVTAFAREELGAWPRLRLRSSTNAEDLPDFNGAGLYRSRGWNVGSSGLESKLLSVLSSVWTRRAHDERTLAGIAPGQVAMAVLLSPAFVDERANGVVLAHRTEQGLRVQIDVAPGENSVAHGAPGESFVLVGGHMHVQRLSPGPGVFLGPQGGVVETEALNSLAAASEALLDSLVGEQVAQGDLAPYGVDVEFKLVGETLFLKQVRLLSLQGRHHLQARLVGDVGGGALVSELEDCIVPEGQTLAVDWVEERDGAAWAHVVGGAACPRLTDSVASPYRVVVVAGW